MSKSIPAGYCYNHLKDVEEKISHMKFIENKFSSIDISSDLFHLFMISSSTFRCSEEEFKEKLSNCSSLFNCESFYSMSDNCSICKSCPYYEVISKDKKHELNVISYLFNSTSLKDSPNELKEFLDTGLTPEHFNTVYFQIFDSSIFRRFYTRELFSSVYYSYKLNCYLTEKSLLELLLSSEIHEFKSLNRFNRFKSSPPFKMQVDKLMAIKSAEYLVENVPKCNQNSSEYCITEEVARRILLNEVPKPAVDPETNLRIQEHLNKIKNATDDLDEGIPLDESLCSNTTEEVPKNIPATSDEQVVTETKDNKKEDVNSTIRDELTEKPMIEESKEETKKEEDSSNIPSRNVNKHVGFLERNSEDIPEGTVVRYGLPKNLKFKIVDVPSDFSEDPKVIKVHTVPEFEKIDYYLMFLCPVYTEYLDNTKQLAIYLPPEDLILLFNTKNKGIMRRLSFYFEEERREKVTYDALELHRVLLKNSIVGNSVIGLKQLYEINHWTSKEIISKKSLFKRTSEFDENPFRNLRNYKQSRKFLRKLEKRNPVNYAMYKVFEPLYKLFGKSKFVEHHSTVKDTYRNSISSSCSSESISDMISQSTNLVVYRILLTNIEKIINTDIYQENSKDLTPFGLEFRLSDEYSVEDLRRDLIKEVYLATLVEITSIKDFFNTSIRVIQVDEDGIILCNKIKDHKATFDIFNQNLAKVSKRLYDGYVPAIKIYKLK